MSNSFSRYIPGLILVLILVSMLGLSARPHDASRQLEQSQRALEAGAYLPASDHLAQAAEQLPERTELWSQAGHYALQGGQPGTAIDYFLRIPPTARNADDLLNLGDAYQQTGDFEAAIQSWQAALTVGGPAVSIYQRLVAAHLKSKDYPAAIQDLQYLTILLPGDASLYYQLGLATATQYPESALVQLARAAELDPNLASQARTLQRAITSARVAESNTVSLMAAGRGLASLGEWKYAEEALRQATLASPDYAEAWAYLGEARQHTIEGLWPEGNKVLPPETGLPELQKAIDLDPKSIPAYLFLAMYWRRHDRYDQALASLQTAVKYDPQNPYLQVEMGETLASLGDLNAALGAYRKAVELSPNDPSFINLLVGFSLKYEYHIEEIALPAARQAVILAPDDPQVLDSMGQVFIKLDDQLNAERFINRALEKDPNFAPAYLHLGQVYLLQGKLVEARTQLNQVTKLAPDSPAADQAQRLIRAYFP
jgi:tetratricopeptide (TPR) repeat protein